jgi:hypothetical protein
MQKFITRSSILAGGKSEIRFIRYNATMEDSDLQSLCDAGQQQLMAMQYLLAERTLTRAEEIAWQHRDFDALARLYMPLQEARRQRRQRCGEGIIRFDLIAEDQQCPILPGQIIREIPQGQLLVAGWGTIAPALETRRLAAENSLFLDVLLGAVYPAGVGRIVAIVPTADVSLPSPQDKSVDAILTALPPHSMAFAVSDLPAPSYSSMMNIWERLHAPFLAAADAIPNSLPEQKIQAWRKAIAVDYACELAHQHISDLARQICQSRRKS